LIAAQTQHWPEYLMEAAGLGLFMISACTFNVILDHPASFVRNAIPNSFVRRTLGGMAMGLTAIGLIYSPWGKRSGAHLNPALTLTFFRLGKIAAADAFSYVFSQFAGGVAGVMFSAALWVEQLPTRTYAMPPRCRARAGRGSHSPPKWLSHFF
jgi:aquaporin Z